MDVIRRLKVLLASRKLFRNWFSAGIRYYLVKGGFLRVDSIEVVCRDCSRGLIPVKAYRVLVNDYYNLMIITMATSRITTARKTLPLT